MDTLNSTYLNGTTIGNLSSLYDGNCIKTDPFSLVGALLSSQLFTQVVLAVYFVVIDVFLIGQFIFYKSREVYRERNKKGQDETNISSHPSENHVHSLNTTSGTITPVDDLSSVAMFDGKLLSQKEGCGVMNRSVSQEMNDLDQLERREEGNLVKVVETVKMNSHFMVSAVAFTMILMICSYQISAETHQSSILSFNTGRKLFTLVQEDESIDHNAVEFPPKEPKKIIGYVIGFISTVCYLGSRISQIVKNFRRSSTEGMNPILFGSLFCGYVLYSISIFLFSVDYSFLMSKFPWITTSVGNLMLDGFILCQYVYYTFIRKRIQSTQ